MATNERDRTAAAPPTAGSADPSACPAAPAPPAWIGAVMPLILSLFFHLGVAMILAFAMAVTIAMPPPPIAPIDVGLTNPMGQRETLFVPNATTLTGGDESRRPHRIDANRPFPENSPHRPEHDVIIRRTDSAGPVTAMLPDGNTGISGKSATTGGGGLFLQGVLGGRAGRGGVTGISGARAEVDNIIFVIDRSGSMLADMPRLRQELKKAVRQLKPNQRFALILFTSGEPREFSPSRLVAADEATKSQFFAYASDIEAGGRTDPMPALKRAFTLARSAPKSQYTAICLLSDGVFPAADAATQFVQQAAANTNIHVFTYLYGQANKEAELMMKRIAHEGKGSYNFVTRE